MPYALLLRDEFQINKPRQVIIVPTYHGIYSRY